MVINTVGYALFTPITTPTRWSSEPSFTDIGLGENWFVNHPLMQSVTGVGGWRLVSVDVLTDSGLRVFNNDCQLDITLRAALTLGRTLNVETG